MKTKQTKIDRSAAKWLPGAMALAATTASSQAATVQITLTGNKISTNGGDQLVADVTGDGGADIAIAGFRAFGPGGVFAQVDGFWVYARYDGPASRFYVEARFEAGGGGASIGRSPRSLSYLNAITFTDSRINGGNLTEGWLQVNAFNTSATDHTVEFSRLIFDNASTTAPIGVQTTDVAYPAFVAAVPEPGSNLALLALGAGGLTLRRRLKRAA
jgi:hypothetical protein